MQNITFTMLNMISSMIHDIPVDIEEIKKADMEALYICAKKHSLLAMVGMGLEGIEGLFDEDSEHIEKAFKSGKDKAVRNSILFDFEWTQIKGFLKNQGIWYMPLKGMLLKDYYPRSGMRQMADHDILFDKNFQKDVFDYMTGQGYESFGFGKSNHDVYQKAPIFNFEMHTDLYDSNSCRLLAEYYENIKLRLIKDEDNEYGYHFKDEDFYIYYLSHSYKHYSNGGIGIRALLDLYLFLDKKEDSMDWNYIATELKALQLEAFEKESRELCKKLFSLQVHELSEKDQEILAYYIGSGTYGNIGNLIEKRLMALQPDNESIRFVTKLKYCMIRLFPGKEHYKNVVPIVYRHKWMIPFYLVFRALRGVVNKKKRKNLKYEIERLKI